ncbi:IS66 family transposase [Ligilactobacillus ruminis]|uniref:IS66 family transposase n=1 Tax=Ligilactobacillus ruminis TaxID=1623 RepID=UPI003A4E0D30
MSGFNGYVQTDGYAGYNFLDRTRHLVCLAHFRRYFVDSLKNSSCKASKSFSGEIVKDINKVFELERNLSAKFNDDERLLIFPHKKHVPHFCETCFFLH